MSTDVDKKIVANALPVPAAPRAEPTPTTVIPATAPTTTAAAATPFVPPDGGRKAWLAVAGGFLCQFCSFGFVNALGSFQYVYEKEILPTQSSSNITWILTTQLFLMFFLSQPLGLAADMFGVRAVLAPASLFSVGGLIALSFASEYWQIFLAQSLCFGLGAAGVFISGLVAPGQYFGRKRPLVLGIVAAGSSTGGLVFPIMLARLFAQIGFRQTLRYTGLMVGVLLAIANLLVTTPIPPKGLSGRRSLVSLANFKRPTYLIFVGGSFLFFWGLFGPFDYLPIFASADPSTATIALYSAAIINAASIPGRILPNFYSTRVGSSLRILAVSALVAGASVFIIWLPIYYHRSEAGLIIFVLVFGFASGAFISLMTPALIEVAGGNPSELGTMLGSFFVIVAVADLTGLPIQGAIEGGSSGLAGLIVFCGVVMLAGAVLLGVAAWRAGKAKEEAKKAAERREAEEKGPAGSSSGTGSAEA
ncbi:uncharacterized protein C8A04DRAFT_11519 [Dichotomopilus funicola]|uniref:Major facilitator superfamily (MFS) profile domain-containing protein n=1 Tax=Dichotomopilus funicola TaxID=1934379 RepID=A0AAN6V5G3_9PEZI|nr:hypothetical protein C8A04DRAFT_11519 [Dichotomopilus funicola]